MVPSSLTTSTSTPAGVRPASGRGRRPPRCGRGGPARRPRGSAAGRRGPGRVRSHGSVAESASTRAVWARSAALMPVRDAVAGVDGDRVGRAQLVLVVRRHQRDLEPVEHVAGHRHADHAAGVPDGEGHQLGRRLGGGEDDVALVLAVLVVDDDDAPAGRDVGDRPARRGRGGRCSRRVMPPPSRCCGSLACRRAARSPAATPRSR